jgi:hypothetical protein
LGEPEHAALVALLSSAIHGTSFHVEDASRLDTVRPYGWGLAISGYRVGSGYRPAVWVHAAVPTPSIWTFIGDGSSTSMQSATIAWVWLQFDASASREFYVTNLHVWSGRQPVAALNDLRERGPTYSHRFNPPLWFPGAGINLSIGIELPILIDSTGGRPAPPTFVLNGAAVYFDVRGI